MGSYLIRRLLQSVLVLIGVTFVVYFILFRAKYLCLNKYNQLEKIRKCSHL